MYWFYASTCKQGFSPSIETCSEHKHGVFSDMKVKIKILTNFNFIIFIIVHVHAKIIAQYLFLRFKQLHYITLLILKFFYLSV